MPISSCRRYPEDARLLPPNHPMITGRSQISEAFREFLGAGMGELTIDTYEIEIAGSGDLAYGIGTFSLGRPAPDRGKFGPLPGALGPGPVHQLPAAAGRYPRRAPAARVRRASNHHRGAMPMKALSIEGV
jgi:hypothetical protein